MFYPEVVGEERIIKEQVQQGLWSHQERARTEGKTKSGWWESWQISASEENCFFMLFYIYYVARIILSTRIEMPVWWLEPGTWKLMLKTRKEERGRHLLKTSLLISP